MVKILPQIVLGLWSIAPGNYSGITNIDDKVYAIVDDKCRVDGFKLLTLDIDSVSGKIRDAELIEPSGMRDRRANGSAVYRDCEGVAYFPTCRSIFVSGEEDQRIMEYTIDGWPTGRELPIPAIMQRSKITRNLGFEALTYNAVQHRFWTTTESTLPADGAQSSAKNPDVVNQLRFVSFDDSLQVASSYLYAMDKPHGHKAKGTSIHGVPSLVALDDGRIIVMEREGYFPKKNYGSWVKIKLYVVNPAEETPFELNRSMSEASDNMFMKKELLATFTTHLRLFCMNLSNYEGMCLGPKLADGRQTLILIADSQNGKGNSLYHIKDHVRIIIL